MIRLFIIFFIVNSSYCFAEESYRKKIENFAESLILSKYDKSYELDVNNKLQISITPLDKRLKFTPCTTDLTGNLVSEKLKKNTSVKVMCSDPKPWTTYVRAKVRILLPRVTTNIALIKGKRITPDNIKISYVTKSRARNGSFDQLNTLIGTRLKRNLSADKIITERDVCFVCKGDKVTIQAIKSGLAINASGIALNDANIGSTVRVKNSRTQRIVLGTVSAPKVVQVSF